MAVIVYGTWGLLYNSVNLALDGVPAGIDMEGVKEYLTSLPTCVDIHDLHVWGMSSTEAALTAHLVMAKAAYDDALLAKTASELHKKLALNIRFCK